MRSDSRAACSFLLGAAFAFAATSIRASETDELRSQIEAQNELIRQQAGALERQSQELSRMSDRVRVLEDERAAVKSAPVIGIAEPGAVEPGAGESSLPTPHVPGSGFRVKESEWGSFNARIYTYVRYLNQQALDEDFTDSFGQTSAVDTRHDVQINKVSLYAFGWLFDPKLTYLLYVWSANTSQGLGAQVVVAGNLKYAVNEYLTIGGGIRSLPGTRSTSENFPYWLGVDQRLIADEYFRPSYTSGIWAEGRIAEGLDYTLMVGNNLSQLGVDAGQLDAQFNTVSAALDWTPLGEYGRGFGDFAEHPKLATQLGLRFTRSREDAQGQPDTEAFENVQIRLSDGNVIFEPGLFGQGIQIRDALYQMVAVAAGAKYRGLALEGEYFYRQVDDFRGPGVDTIGFDRLEDHGFQLQASAMLIPKKLQAYTSGSMIFGDYGDPWEARAGFNWFPFENVGTRWNAELIYVNDSPVGALSLPYLVGSTGPIFHTSFEIFY